MMPAAQLTPNVPLFQRLGLDAYLDGDLCIEERFHPQYFEWFQDVVLERRIGRQLRTDFTQHRNNLIGVLVVQRVTSIT